MNHYPESYFKCLNNSNSLICPRGCCGNSCPDYKTVKQINKYRYVSRSTRYKVLSRQCWCCNMCGCRLKYSLNSMYPGEVAHIDHIIPFSERQNYSGDINCLENLQALCPTCNLGKSKKKIH